jgi:hypothetical protein
MRKPNFTKEQCKWWMNNYNQVLHNSTGEKSHKSRKPPELFAALKEYISKNKELLALKKEIIEKFCK